MITGLVRSAKRDTGIARRADQLASGRHCLEVLNGFGNRNGHYVTCLQSHHHTTLAIRKRTNRTRSEIRCEHSIECVGPSTALKMTEHHAPRLPTSNLFEILLQVLTDTTKPGR